MFTELISHPLLLPVLIPLGAGLLCLLIPAPASRAADSIRALLAVLSSAVILGLAWQLFRQLAAGPAAGLLADELHIFLWPLLSLRLDALSGFILLAVTLFGLLIAIFSTGYMKGHPRHRAYFTLYLWTLGISCLAVLANELLLLLVCWGFLGLLLYLMIGIAGPDAAGAARKSLMVIGGADALLLFGIVLYWQISGSTAMDGEALALDSPTAYVTFLAFLCGAFAKAGVVPFHSWVPDFGEKAQAPVSAYLPASLDKLLGIYLLARIMLDLFVPTPSMFFMLMLLGSVTVIGAVLMALVQHDLKRLLSYHAVSQVGYMVLGIGTGTVIGLAGGLFHMLNNAIYKSTLFLCAGVVEKETGTTDLDRLGGLARLMPVTFIACTVAALSISGIPPLNGFASKWMIYQGVIESGGDGGGSWIIWLAVAMLGSALTLASFVKVLHATFLCKPSPEVLRTQSDKGITDGTLSMRLPLMVLAVTCVAFGIFAFQLPLAQGILPAVPGGDALLVDGVWWSGLATVLILGSIFIGLIVYWLTMRSGKLRRVRTYIGGEQMSDVYVSGDPAGEGRNVEVTGVDFYDTIEALPAARRFYRLTHEKAFDIYHLLRKGVMYLVQPLRAAHTGVLPAYMRWFVAGLLVVVWVVTQTQS